MPCAQCSRKREHALQFGRAHVCISLLLVVSTLAVGCASSNRVTLRTVPQNPLVDELQLASYYGPRPSERTEQLLRVHNLTYKPRTDPRGLIKRLQEFNNYEPTADRVYAMSELSYLGGMEAQRVDKQVALDLFGASVLYSYQYLFDDRYKSTRNPYDPQYRGVCDLYNSALESGLRIICTNKELKPETSKTITRRPALGTSRASSGVRSGGRKISPASSSSRTLK